MVKKVYITYNEVRTFAQDDVHRNANKADNARRQVHKLCQASADHILNTFQPNLMIAIGGGGYVPARILRSFLKRASSPNIPIQAIGLSLYESLPPADPSAPTTPVETPGTKVTRTQWLDLSSLSMASLVGKNILIVDEVDDTRTTLEYAVRELEKDVEAARQKLGGQGKATFSIFVLHNKEKPKKGHLPKDMIQEGRYLAAETVDDVWICYPWEATYVNFQRFRRLVSDGARLTRCSDIDEHDMLAASQGTV